MASSYPSTYDSTAGPSASDKTNSATYPHATLHTDSIARAVAMQKKVGLSTAGVGGSSYPSTRIGDSLAVNSTGGHTAWGTFHQTKIAEAIATASGVASFDFTAIPSHFSGLRLAVAARSESTGNVDNLRLQMGSGSPDTGASYDYNLISGSGATVSASPTGGSSFLYGGGMAGSTGSAVQFSRSEISLFNYASTQMRKGVLVQSWYEQSGTSSSQYNAAMTGGQWNSSLAVDTIRLSPQVGSGFSVGTRATLYGLP